MSGGEVQIVSLCKRFGDVEAVAGIDLHIARGEFFSILGPSGCGKTTTLRLVAGFEQPTSGSIFLDGEDVAHKPPHRRNVNTVFQNYALFPFLSVADNVGFGLRYQNLSKAEMAQRVGSALELVQLLGYEKRRPGQMSGGQQQRVALARALVLNPSVLLLDEPLGALDAKLRRTLQVELKSLQETVGITFLYVTHDQEEALTMSDRLAVMETGKVAQVGTPVDVYEEPADAYVADFLGVSNLMDAHADGQDAGGACRIRLGEFDLSAERGMTGCTGAVKVAIRPERVQIEPYESSGLNRVPAMVERLVFLGSSTQILLRLAHGVQVQALMQNEGGPPSYQQGNAVQAYLPADALRVLRGSAVAYSEDTMGAPETEPSVSVAGPLST
ncbi:MAG TPA: ABC transporter ATP-binding protein [Acidimicrobiales bacterium]|jgi:spermidine/putrescine transport system ATP-binding protein